MKNLFKMAISTVIISTSFFTLAYAETKENSLVTDITPKYECKAIVTEEGLKDNISYSFKEGNINMQPSDCLLMINGQFVPLKGIIENGTTFVPLRVISESFGSKVHWDEKTNQVSISNSSTNIIMNIGKEKAVINGTEKTLNFAPFIENGSTYVPIRFVSETLGKSVGYLPAFKEENYPNTELMAYNAVVWVDNTSEMSNSGISEQYMTNWLKWQLSNNKKLFEQNGNSEAFTEADLETTSYLGQVGRYALFKSVCPILVDMSNKTYYLVNLQHGSGGIYKEETFSDKILDNIFTEQNINANSDNSKVKAKVKLFEGVYFDNAIYGEEPAPDTDLEIKISNITEQSFEFSIYKRNIATGKTEILLSNKTAIFTGNGTQAVFSDDSQNMTFSFPDNHGALPIVTDIQIKGNKLLEGKTFVNNNIPGHTFG